MEGARFGGVARVMTRSVLQRVSDESLTRVSQKRIFQKCVAVLSQKGVSKSVSEECLQEMPTRVSQKGVFKEIQRVSSQECPSLMWFEEVAFPINSPGQSSALLLHRCAKKDLGNFKKHPQRRRVNLTRGSGAHIGGMSEVNC